MGIHVQKAKKSFSGKSILRKVDLFVKKGESMVLMGPSGSGKSLLMRCILGLESLDSGSVCVDSIQGRAFLDISGVVFQSFALFDSLNVFENISFLCKREFKTKGLVMSALDQVGLSSSVASLYPFEISGGMKRRVSIARALYRLPKYLFFDEPTEGLDPISSHSISTLIRDVVKKTGATALTICHNMQGAFIIGDQISFLDSGTIRWGGSTKRCLSSSAPIVKDFLRSSKCEQF